MCLLHKTLCVFFLGPLFFSNVYGSAVQDREKMLERIDSIYINAQEYLDGRNYEQASETFTRALELARFAADSLFTGKIYERLGTLNLYREHYAEAMKLYLKGMDFIDETTHLTEGAKLHNGFGHLHARLGEYPKAETHFKKALALAREEDRLILSITGNLVGLYMESEQYEKAEEASVRAIALAERLGNKGEIGRIYTNLSSLYSDQGRGEEALEAGLKSLKIKKETDYGGLVTSFNNIGYAYNVSGKPDSAVYYYREALEHTNNPWRRLHLFNNLKNTYDEMGDLPRTLEYFKEYDELKDSLTKIDQKARVAEMEEKYESEQKQTQIDHLQAEKELQGKLINRQRILVGISLVLLLLFAGLVYVWIKQNRTRQALEKSRLQQRFLLTQLNPHFIFNALQSVQNFIFKNETDTSMKYLNSFSRLIRSVLESSDRDTIALGKEMEMTRNFLQLQQLNHQNSFTYEITPHELPEAMDGLCIPVMLVQPFVENAVIHGIQDVPEGKISIDLEKEENTLKITICDNGKGIYPRDKQKANALHRSMGSEIVNKRISEFNKVNEREISVAIMPLREHPEFPGTKVVMQVPVF